MARKSKKTTGKAQTSLVASQPKNKIKNVKKIGVSGAIVATNQDGTTLSLANAGLMASEALARFLARKEYKGSGFVGFSVNLEGGDEGQGTSFAGITNKATQERHMVARVKVNSVQNDEGQYEGEATLHIGDICSTPVEGGQSPASVLFAKLLVGVGDQYSRLKDAIDSVDADSFATIEEYQLAIRKVVKVFVANQSNTVKRAKLWPSLHVDAGETIKCTSNSRVHPEPRLDEEGLKILREDIDAIDAILIPLQAVYPSPAPKRERKTATGVFVDCSEEDLAAAITHFGSRKELKAALTAYSATFFEALSNKAAPKKASKKASKKAA